MKLKIFTDQTIKQLKSDVKNNQAKYIHGDFSNLDDNTSSFISHIEYDDKVLSKLDIVDGMSVGLSDVKNSLLIGKALEGMTAAEANESSVWTRLTHIECFEYTKKRWLKLKDEKYSDDDIITHFFADTQTQRRDDNGISRLWWNYYIAKKCMPEDIELALNLFVSKTDIRSNFVERVWLSTRKSIASAVLRALRDNKWLSSNALHFREFMKALNMSGAGVVFEALSDYENDLFINGYLHYRVGFL